MKKFGKDELERQLIHAIRTHYRKDPQIRFVIRRLAHECKVKPATVFFTAAAIVREDPKKILAVANELEQLTTASPNPAMRNAEVVYIGVRLARAASFHPLQ